MTKRLFTIFAALVLLTTMVSTIAIFTLRWTIETKDQLLSRYAEVEVAIENLGQLSDRRGRKLRAFLLTGRSRFRAERAQSLGEFNAAVRAIEPLLDDPREQRLLREVAELNAQLVEIGDQLVDMKLAGASNEQVEAVLVLHLQPVADDADEAMANLTQRVENRSQAQTRQANRRVANASTLLGSAIASAVIFSLLLGLTLHRTTRRILAEQDELDRASRYQQEVTGIVSHDLRSPLSAILTTANLSLRSSRSPTEQNRMQRILRSAHRIETLANVLLDVTRLHVSRRIPLVLEDADFHGLVADRMASSSPEDKQLSVEHLRVGDGQARFDGERLGQTVDILLEHAMNKAEPSSNLRIVSRGEDSSVSLEITAHGRTEVGTFLAQMFDPFGGGPQDEKEPVRLSRGFGLYLARELASAHGGTLDVRSDDGDTLVFRLHMPRTPPETPAPTTASPARAGSWRSPAGWRRRMSLSAR